MKVLAIDTSTSHGSVAFLSGGELLVQEKFIADRGHGSALVGPLQRVRELTSELDVIAVGLGPGSYAGVRIAIATGMGLSFALRAKLVGIPSVAALECEQPRYLAVGDARRETFYFSRVEAGVCLEGPVLLDANTLRERLASTSDWPVLASELLAIAPQATIAFPSAVILARLAAENRGIIAEGALEPLYLREPHITQPKSC